MIVKAFTSIQEFFQIFIQSVTTKNSTLILTDPGCWRKIQNYTLLMKGWLRCL